MCLPALLLGAGPWGHLVPNTELGGVCDTQDPRVQAGRGAAASSVEEPGGSQLPQGPEAMAGMWPMVAFGAGIPLLQAFGANTTAKPTEYALLQGRPAAHRRPLAPGGHICVHGLPGGGAGPLRYASGGPGPGGCECETKVAGPGPQELPRQRAAPVLDAVGVDRASASSSGPTPP